MTKQFSFVFLFFFVTSLIAQNNITISILDSDTKLPIPSVNIKVLGSSIGFSSDVNGKAILQKLDSLSESDTLVLSHIKYFPERLSLKSIKELNYIIKLLPSRQSLEEVVISSKKRKRNHPYLKFQKVTTIPVGLSNFDAFIKDDNLTIIGGMKLSEVDNWEEITQKDKWRETGGPDMGQVLTNTVFVPDWKSYNSNVYKFNLDNKNWSTEKRKTIQRAFHNVNINNDKAYIIGGKRLASKQKLEYLENRIEIINLKNNSIITDKTNPHKATNFASFIYDNNLIVMGGSVKKESNGTKIFSNDVHYQNLNTGIWYKLGNMPIGKETQGVLINSVIYLIGGDNNEPVKNIETYNLITGKWKKEGELFKGMSNPGLATSQDIIYIFEKLCGFLHHVNDV